MIESIQELLQKEAQAVLNIPVTDAYEKAVELIVEQIHRKKGKLVTSGMGKAGQIAMNIATTFLFDRNSLCLPAPQRGTTRRSGHPARERPVIIDFKFR